MSQQGLINPQEWPLQTPFGPMLHRDTGESYQAMGARLEYEHKLQKRLADEAPKGRVLQ